MGRNAAINRRRVEQRRAELATGIEPPAAVANPETALLVRERRGLVRRALALLPRPQRRAALLRFHGELPFQTVAVRLGTREVTARTRVQRALISLRERLSALRAILVVPGAQAAVLGLTVVVTQLPAAPSPMVLAMTDDDVVTAERPRARPVRMVAVPAAAVATETAAPREERRKDVTTYSAVQRIPFEDDLVEGNVKGPEGEIITSPRPAVHSSLMESAAFRAGNGQIARRILGRGGRGA